MHSYHTLLPNCDNSGAHCHPNAQSPGGRPGFTPRRDADGFAAQEEKGGDQVPWRFPDLIPSPPLPLAPAAVNLDVEVADLLAQRVAVEAQEVGGADLV